MTSTHKAYSWIAGDDFRLFIQLIDQTGKPFEIDGLTEIKWLIHTPAGEILPHESIISTIDSATGKISIWIPASETTKWPGGIYTDWLRINCGGIISTLLTGPINVTADPWRAPVAQVEGAIAGFSNASVVVTMLDRRERIKHRTVAEADAKVLQWRRASGRRI